MAACGGWKTEILGKSGIQKTHLAGDYAEDGDEYSISYHQVYIKDKTQIAQLTK